MRDETHGAKGGADVALVSNYIGGHRMPASGSEIGNIYDPVSCSGNVARTFHRTIKVGMVRINVPLPVPMVWQGFGGWRKSLFGDMHVCGEKDVQIYTRLKSIMQRRPEDMVDGAEFSMPVAR